jgi:amino acid adenylation domain-containing protein
MMISEIDMMENRGQNDTIDRLFVDVVRHHADEIAVSKGENRLTYRELNNWANQAAFALAPTAENNRVPVALLFGQGLAGIVGSLAALKAGRPYSYLDERSPMQEHETILQDLGSQVLLTDSAQMQRARDLARDHHLTVVNLEELPPDLALHDRPADNNPADVAAIYYTSGTTGHPKGVIRTHRTILGRLQVDRWCYKVGPGDNLALLRNLNFAAACATVHNGLLNGATLHLAEPRQMSAVDVARWLVEKRITSLRAQTVLLRQIMDVVPQSFCFSDMRYCRPSGRLLRTDVERLWRHLPDSCLLGHGLASTETSLVAYLNIQRGELPHGKIIPVGCPIKGVEIMLLDQEGQPVPEGEVGEIVVSGRNVTPGYWGNDELSAQKIKQDPTAPNRRIMSTGDLGRLRADKLLEFVGRRDNQVKVRGYRIELEAVEAALEQLPGVAQAAVRAIADDRGDRQLVGYVEPEIGINLSTTVLRHQLSEQVPEYMVPVRLIEMQELPLGTSGKVKLAALPDPGRSRPELELPYAAPRSSTEIELAKIWSELLDIEKIGIDDSFFDLGGQSLLAASVVTRIRAVFQIDIPLKTMFEAATVATLAEKIDAWIDDSGQTTGADLEENLRMLGY